MLNYREQGEGEALVFLHGFCSDLHIWDDFILPFTEEYRVIRIDLPGCGESPLGESSIKSWAKACWETLSALGIQQGNLVGHSMGGYVALEMMALALERVVRFASFHSSPLADNDERRSNRYKQITFIDKYGPKMLVSQIIPALFHTDFDEERMMTAVEIAENQTAGGLKSALDAMANRSDNREILYGAEIPVLFLSGRHDAILPLADQKQFAAACIRAQLVELEQTAHMGMMEEKEKAQKSLAEFLAST